MNFAWKYMVPLSLINILAAAVWFECVIRPRPFFAGMIGTRPEILGWQLPVNALIGWILTLLILVPSAWLVMAINRQERADSQKVTTTLRSPRVPVAAR
jgi:NADH-quinone oxidoreductase subunit H